MVSVEGSRGWARRFQILLEHLQEHLWACGVGLGFSKNARQLQCSAFTLWLELLGAPPGFEKTAQGHLHGDGPMTTDLLSGPVLAL